MKIFIFYGSEVSVNSNASLFLQLLIEQLKNNTEVESVILRSSNNTKLSFMNNWSDVISTDGHKDRDIVKTEILESDVLLFISPVYLHNVSAFSKLFLDNFAAWAHTMPLIGKLGVPISLSSNNGNIFVNDYLKKILSYWGLSTIAPISIELSFMKRSALLSYVRFIIKDIFESINDLDSLTNKMQEDIYYTNWNNIYHYEKDHPERLEFEKNNNINHRTFRSALKTKLGNGSLDKYNQV